MEWRGNALSSEEGFGSNQVAGSEDTEKSFLLESFSSRSGGGSSAWDLHFIPFFILPSPKRSPGAVPSRPSVLDTAALHGFFRFSLLMGCYSTSSNKQIQLKREEHMGAFAATVGKVFHACSLSHYQETADQQLLMDYISSFSLFRHTDLYSTCCYLFYK